VQLTGEKRSTRRETCPSATLSTTNRTWTGLGLNQDLRGERPLTNCPCHSTAHDNYDETVEAYPSSFFKF
jgi:hypothetical protein